MDEPANLSIEPEKIEIPSPPSPVEVLLPAPVLLPPVVKEKKESMLFYILALILIVAGLAFSAYNFMQKKNSQTASVAVPTLAPQPTESIPMPTPDVTANWETYTNTKYGFEFMYPQNLNYISLGSNSAQKEVDQGKEISGTVVPSFDTINFREGDKNKKFSVEIFKENETALTPENYQNGLYMSGSCDLRWLDNKPSVVKNTELNGNNLLEVNITGPKQYVSCYYIKNRNGNLIVINSEVFTNESTFGKINEEITKILSTFKFTANDENCIAEGGKGNYTKDLRCCQGLAAITYPSSNPPCSASESIYFSCYKCGDGKCGNGETKCNCPSDCN